MLDFSKLHLGDVDSADGIRRTFSPGLSRMHYSPTGGLLHLRSSCSVQGRKRLLEQLGDDCYASASAGEIGRRLGMCANQSLYEYAATYLRSRAPDVEFPDGTVMHGHAKLMAERAARAAATAPAARRTGRVNRADREPAPERRESSSPPPS